MPAAKMICWTLMILLAESQAVLPEEPSIPTAADLAQRLIDRVEKLDNVDVTYRHEEEFLFPVAGMTPARLQPLLNGRYRTVFSGQKRRFERYPENRTDKKFPTTLVIFDGNYTAEGHMKDRDGAIKAASVFLREGKEAQSNADCQACLSMLQKPLSDAAIAQSFDNRLFPFSLRLAMRKMADPLVQVDPVLRSLEGTECCVVRFPMNGDSYWLDPKRDFALIRREMFETVGEQKVLVLRSTARDFRRHGDLWVPYSYVGEHGAPPHTKDRAGEVFYRVKLTIEKISIGEATAEDFKIQLADGASINDVDHGQMLVNPTNRLAEVASLVAEVESKKSRWWWLSLASVVVAALTFYGWRAYRRKTRGILPPAVR